MTLFYSLRLSQVLVGLLDMGTGPWAAPQSPQ